MSKLHDRAAAILRRLPPETAHNLTLWGLAHGYGPRVAPDPYPSLQTALWGQTFPNPIGIAAGFDKNAVAVDGALALGAGFVEIGGVTPKAQIGNPKPRLFRLPKDRALINRMGFNNDGLAAVAARLERPLGAGIVGANLAANAGTADPIADFVELTQRLAPHARFLTADISCPNTRNGQIFLEPAALQDLLSAIAAARNETHATPPLLVKLSPDVDDRRLQELLSVIMSQSVDGLIICNTTKARPSTLRGRHRGEAGGLSGQPLAGTALDMLRRVHARTRGDLRLISVGGIAGADDAYRRIRAGASLIQLYTGLVYAGPNLIPAMMRGLDARLRRDGFTRIADAVGADDPS